MEINLLKEELKDLQIRYKNVLLKAKDNIFRTDTNAIVDEINVFWYKNRKLVEFALRNLVRPYQAYIFTGACTLDVENYEHYPFVSLGKFHIWDDPICNYINIVDKSFNSDFNKKMKKQIVETISDNLKILDEAEEIIYILPIRFLSNDIKQLIYDAGKQVFLSMFDKRYSFEEYMDKFSTIDDIRASLRSGIEQYIIFTEDEDISIAFETRFAKYKETTTLPVSKDACDAEIFLVAILGYLSQAFDILFTCIEYQLNPYIDFDVAFEYMLIISSNFKTHKEIQTMVFKGAVSHILHQRFNKEKIKHMDFKRYYTIIQESDFETRLFSKLEEQGVTIDNLKIGLISEIIDNLLNLIL